ncbi:MAG: UDP-N-acetylmuramoyl-tripeptide--D-alanyl-D-alanine ligase [Deltaproteobacteria bacterium HGW-Deltaproteobacteria-11]|nr:MAG: UDP-N-acetylmuramoyl-tripeptide--D-alanyl-D-alanine ligase [Deltaproteobacteria bacterium HGW-Deltaproteobacteria-11]
MKDKAVTVMTIGEALRATDGCLIRGESDRLFYGVSTDSRTMEEGNLFLCLRGENFDGHHFLAAAAAAGAAGFVIQKDAGETLIGMQEKMPVILVEDTLKALGELARFWRKKLNVPVIAITGSSGKTTTKEITAGILGLTKKVLKTEGNFNNRVGLPVTLLRLTGQHDVAVVEMGTNMPGEIECLTRIAEPDIGLITNIGAAHLEKLKSLAGIREEKWALFENMSRDGIAVINRDDKSLEFLGRRWQGKQITFGWKHRADVSAWKVRKAGPVGIVFRLRAGQADRPVQMQVSGGHNLYNALGAAAASLAFGADIDSICQGLESFRGVSGRFEIQALQNGAHVINDSYNANPVSVREALKTLKELRGSADSAVILGDMLELGSKAGAWHRKIGRQVAETGVQSLLLMGDYRCDTAAGAMEKGMTAARIISCETPEQIQDYLQSSLKPGDWVLVKGSRKMKMERIVRMITETFGLQERAVA